MAKSEIKWIRLGEFVVPSDKKNNEGLTLPVMGLNAQKSFMPTVANYWSNTGSFINYFGNSYVGEGGGQYPYYAVHNGAWAEKYFTDLRKFAVNEYYSQTYWLGSPNFVKQTDGHPEKHAFGIGGLAPSLGWGQVDAAKLTVAPMFCI